MEQIHEQANVNLICTKIDNIIKTCDDGLKGLTNRPNKYKLKQADFDNISHCSETGWPPNQISENFKKVISVPPWLLYGGCDTENVLIKETNLAWPLCCKFNSNEPKKGACEFPFDYVENDLGPKRFDTANIRGPCGKTDCRIARDLRYYIEDLAEEDDMMVNLDDLVGPCGSTSCNFVKNLKDFIFHRGVFAFKTCADPKHCTCTEEMEKALTRKSSCHSICNRNCEDLNSILCGGNACAHEPEPTFKTKLPTSNNPSKTEQLFANESTHVQSTYFVMVKLDEKPGSNSESKLSSTPKTSSNTSATGKSDGRYKYCATTCPKSDAGGKCSNSTCDLSEAYQKLSGARSLACFDSSCPNKETGKQEAYTPSPADSDVEIDLAELRNPCNVKSCDASARILEYIMNGINAKQKCTHDGDDSCFCDCSKGNK